MKKKDVNHLNRSELIDLVYQMDKSNTALNTSVSEQIKQERRKIRQKKAIRKFILTRHLHMKAMNHDIHSLFCTLYLDISLFLANILLIV